MATQAELRTQGEFPFGVTLILMFEAILAAAYLGVQLMDDVSDSDKKGCLYGLFAMIPIIGATYIVGVAHRPEVDD